MLTLLKHLDCYTPKHIGRNDILLCYEKIVRIESNIPENDSINTVYDFENCMAFPGLIDPHVHIIGGGGEEGFSSHISEVAARDLLKSGITTVVGLLGADGTTRSLESLYAKAKALDADGITAFLYAGSYSLPSLTLTGNLVRDLVLIDPVIGVKTAISDHRSSHAGLQALLKTASDVHLGGMLSGKAGVMHLHVGDGKAGLKPLYEVLESSDLPMEQFVPTHQNRSPELFSQAVEYCRAGGNIDLTTGETVGVSVPDAINRLIRERCGLGQVTLSSDGNGSKPGGGIASVNTLFGDVRRCIQGLGIGPETVFSLVTRNSAKVLKLYPRKGQLAPGSDADILITDRQFEIQQVFSKGIMQKL